MLSETIEFNGPIPLDKNAIAAAILIKLASSCGRDQQVWLEAAQFPGKPRSILVNGIDYLSELAK